MIGAWMVYCVGISALLALSGMPNEPRAGAELFRLREKIKLPSVRTLIDRRLQELAAKSGQSIGDMEDQSLPSFGLDQRSMLYFDFDGARAELEVGANETVQRWFGNGGKTLKSIPAEIASDNLRLCLRLGRKSLPLGGR